MPLENELVSAFVPQESASLVVDGRPGTAASSDFLRRLVDSLKGLTGGTSASALPVLLCPSPARYHVRRWLEPFVPKLTVLSLQEIPPEIRVQRIGTIG